MARPRTRDMVYIETAEDITGVSARTLREAVKKGRLRAFRPGGGKFSRLMFDVEDLDAFLEDVEVRPEEVDA